MQRIISILPKGEGFSPQSAGAIAISVRDFTRFSRYRATTTVIGGTAGTGFEGIHYMTPARAHWFENRTRSYARGCSAIARTENAALVEVHNRPHILRLIAGKTDSKLVLHLHNDPQEMDDARTAAERQRLLAQCAGIYCVSEYIRSRFLEELSGDAAKKLHVIYNGMEPLKTIPTKENLIVFAGRMTQDKGALPLAEALQAALPELPDWRAVLIGSRRFAASGNLSAYETQVAETLRSLHTQVTLTGFIPHEETLSYFARAALVMVPSQWEEPFGRTALEALASGAALISSGRGGLREVTGEAALTVDPTPENLADAILTLARDQSARERLQRMGIARGAHFSIARCTEKLDKVRGAILGEQAA